ncbi:MAG: RNA-guided endonuclease InsQ/TnpB family protein [bacterium]
MRKTYKYRLYPTRKQVEKMSRMLDLCRILYNSFLIDRRNHYKETGKTLSRDVHQSVLTQNKREMPFLATDIHSQPLQEVTRRVEKAYKKFFERLKAKNGRAGLPRLKPQNRYNSFTYTQSGFGINEDGKLELSKIGHVKIKLHRRIMGNIKQCEILRDGDLWYACFSVVVWDRFVYPKSTAQIGLDLGLSHRCILSNGDKEANPRTLKVYDKRIKKLSKSISTNNRTSKKNKYNLNKKKIRKKQGSKNWIEAVKKLQTTHRKVRNVRLDVIHKLTTELVKNFGFIAIEKLLVNNLVRNKHLSKSIYDVSWGKFTELLLYKAAEAGINVVQVNPKNTSKTCSKCWHIKEDLTLADRLFVCPHCGLEIDRDVNAAINILRLGLAQVQAQLIIGQELLEFTPGETGSAGYQNTGISNLSFEPGSSLIY